MSLYRYQIRQQIARLLHGEDYVTGTPSGSLATTTFGCPALAVYENDYFNDWHGRFYLGTHKDVDFSATDFVASGGVTTFAPATSGAVDATDLFEMYPEFTPAEINDVINLALSMVANEALQDKVDESLVVDDLLTDGLMEAWTDSSTLTNWTETGTGTLARESTIKREGTYSAKLTNTVGNAFGIYQSISNFGLYAGEKVSLYARIYTATADRVRIQLTDGVTTWNSSYHDGTGWREAEPDPWLKIENQDLSTALTELTASSRIETGAAIDAYVDKMFLVIGKHIYEYTVPTGFTHVSDIYQEASTVGRFSVSANRIDDRHWKIRRGTTPKIWFDNNYVMLNQGRKLRIMGQQAPSLLTADADTCDVSLPYLTYQAKALLHQSRIRGSGSDFDEHRSQMELAQAMADRERTRLRVAPRGWKVSF